MDNGYLEVALLLGVAAIVGALAVRLRQPLIVAFIVAGVLAGPAGLGLVSGGDHIRLLADLGVTVLLFIVGLKLDAHLVRHLGSVAIATGLGQLVFTIVVGTALCLLLGMSAVEALYVSVALTFSSAVIVFKLLGDKRELDTLYGRIATGFLIVQNIAVVVAIMLVGSLQGLDGDAGDRGAAVEIGITLFNLALAILAVLAIMRFVMPRLMPFLARSQELLLVSALAWGVGLSIVGDIAGFSKEVGAFLAGFSLAMTPFREAVNVRLVSVRDFLLLFFFMLLGAQLDLSLIGQSLPTAITLSLFVLIFNPLTVLAIMGFMGYRARTGFLAGLSVAQISELSIIFIVMAISIGHVDERMLGIITFVAIATITVSTYMILYSHQLFRLVEPALKIFERSHPFREATDETPVGPWPEIVVIGLGRYGMPMLETLAHRDVPAMGIDFDPDVIQRGRKAGLDVLYGDADNRDFLDQIGLDCVRCVVSCVPDLKLNLHLLHVLRQRGFAGRVAATAHHDVDERILLESGFSMVLRPYRDAAFSAASQVVASAEQEAS